MATFPRFQVCSSTVQTKQIINFYHFFNHFRPVGIQYRRVRKKKKATNRCIRSLVMVRNQLPSGRRLKLLFLKCTVLFYVTGGVKRRRHFSPREMLNCHSVWWRKHWKFLFTIEFTMEPKIEGWPLQRVFKLGVHFFFFFFFFFWTLNIRWKRNSTHDLLLFISKFLRQSLLIKIVYCFV